MNTTELRVFFHVASTHLMVKNQQIWGTKPEASKSLKANWVVIEQKTWLLKWISSPSRDENKQWFETTNKPSSFLSVLIFSKDLDCSSQPTPQTWTNPWPVKSRSGYYCMRAENRQKCPKKKWIIFQWVGYFFKLSSAMTRDLPTLGSATFWAVDQLGSGNQAIPMKLQ